MLPISPRGWIEVAAMSDAARAGDQRCRPGIRSRFDRATILDKRCLASPALRAGGLTTHRHRATVATRIRGGTTSAGRLPTCRGCRSLHRRRAGRLAPVAGQAAGWWWPKPQIGNTHPGACLPFGMVSACPYTGGYPTGYGRYGKSLQGRPDRLCWTRCESRASRTSSRPASGRFASTTTTAGSSPLTDESGGLAGLGQAAGISTKA